MSSPVVTVVPGLYQGTKGDHLILCPAELQSTSPDLWRDFTKVALASETLRPYWSIFKDSGSQQIEASNEVLSQ